ncbi:MAG: hypothetical protein ACTSUE_25875 [Promethearchaeota archaeon]
MRTNHKIFFDTAQDMGALKDVCVQLVVTSPPYPMIEMWNSVFARMNSLDLQS